MRILISTNLFPPVQTGTSRYAYELACQLSRHGHDVAVLTIRTRASQPPRGKAAEGFEIYRVPGFCLPRTPVLLNFDEFYQLSRPGVVRTIRKIIREFRPDVVHQTGQLLDSVIWTGIAARRERIPAALSIHARIHHLNPVIDGVFRAIDGSILRTAINRYYQRIIGLDRSMTEYANERYGRTDVVNAPMCIEPVSAPSTIRQPRADRAPLIVHSVGHVTSLRGRLSLIRAIGLLRDKGLPLSLVVIGKLLHEPTRDLIRTLRLEDRIQIVGEVSHARVMEILSTAEVEAHWLDTVAGMGNATAEAMCIGAATIFCAPENLFAPLVPLKHGENCFLISDPDDSARVAEILESLWQDAGLARRVGNAGRRLILDYLTWDVMIPRLTAAYQEMVQHFDREAAALRSIA